MIPAVVASFSVHAPADASLLVKNHPLDPGLDRHRHVTITTAVLAGVSDRVHYLETTNLAEIFPKLTGVVLVNSTTGLSAIWRGIPVHALGNPIYKMRGLTNTGRLEDFWTRPEKPDLALYKSFRRVLLHVNHANGDYFTRTGIRSAVHECRRLLADPSPLDELLRKCPQSDNNARARTPTLHATPTAC